MPPAVQTFDRRKASRPTRQRVQVQHPHRVQPALHPSATGSVRIGLSATGSYHWERFPCPVIALAELINAAANPPPMTSPTTTSPPPTTFSSGASLHCGARRDRHPAR